GGISNTGSLSLTSTSVSENRAGRGGRGGSYYGGGGPGGFGGAGGGICNIGIMATANSSVSGNRAGRGGDGFREAGGYGGDGGGIYNAGTVTTTNITVSGNESGSGGNGGTSYDYYSGVGQGEPGGDGGRGGGISSTGAFTLTNSTISGNRTGTGGDGGDSGTDERITGDAGDGGDGGSGGGICNTGSLTVTNLTLSSNRPGGGGSGGIYHGSGDGCDGSDGSDGSGGGVANEGSVTLRDSIIANSTCEECWTGEEGATTTSLGYNLGSDGSCNLTATGDISNSNPLLGPLADNGGDTFTHALLPGSPAIDAGSCTDGEGNPITTDQRGVSRPQGDGCDIGAYEYRTSPPTPTPTPEAYWFNGYVYDDDTGLGIEGVTVKLYQWVDMEWTEIVSRTTLDTGLYGLWAEGVPGKYAIVEVNPEGYVSARAWVHPGFNGTVINPDRVEFDHPPFGLVGMTHFYDVVAPLTETPTVTVGPSATPTATSTLTPTPTLTCTPTATPEVYRVRLPLVFKG
ncbi:MAG: choice-of-anchor Q domain-containing protein, partial [Chloroflexota bacterium]